jgi:hypothetical protein
MKDKDKPLTPKQQAAAVERITRARATRDALQEAMRDEPPATGKAARTAKKT